MSTINTIIENIVRQALDEMAMPERKPVDVYLDLVQYFNSVNRHLRNKWKSKQKTREPITWEEIDQLNDKIHSDLDSIITQK